MYEGPPLPREQIGILRSGCFAASGLTIMTTQIDGKDIADGCADFAVLPGEHHIELSAEQLAPKLEAHVMGLGERPGGVSSSDGCPAGEGFACHLDIHIATTNHLHGPGWTGSHHRRNQGSGGGLVGTMSGTHTIVHPRRNTGVSDRS